MASDQTWADDHVSMNYRRERIRIETDRHRVEGLIHLARDGYRSRVSDVLNASERDFITLTQVTVQPLDGGPSEVHPFLTIARRHIVFAASAPEREPAGAGPARQAGDGSAPQPAPAHSRPASH
jgi:hypothetical protein